MDLPNVVPVDAFDDPQPSASSTSSTGLDSTSTMVNDDLDPWRAVERALFDQPLPPSPRPFLDPLPSSIVEPMATTDRFTSNPVHVDPLVITLLDSPFVTTPTPQRTSNSRRDTVRSSADNSMAFREEDEEAAGESDYSWGLAPWSEEPESIRSGTRRHSDEEVDERERRRTVESRLEDVRRRSREANNLQIQTLGGRSTSNQTGNEEGQTNGLGDMPSADQLLRMFSAHHDFLAREIQRSNTERGAGIANTVAEGRNTGDGSRDNRGIQNLERQQERIRTLMRRIRAHHISTPDINATFPTSESVAEEPHQPPTQSAQSSTTAAATTTISSPPSTRVNNDALESIEEIMQRARETSITSRRERLRQSMEAFTAAQDIAIRNSLRDALNAGRAGGGTFETSMRRRMLESRFRQMRSDQDRLARDFQRVDEQLNQANIPWSNWGVSVGLATLPVPVNTSSPRDRTSMPGRVVAPLDPEYFHTVRGRQLASAARERMERLEDENTRTLFRRRMMALLRLRQGFLEMEQVMEQIVALRNEEEQTGEGGRAASGTNARMEGLISAMSRRWGRGRPRLWSQNVLGVGDARTAGVRRRRVARPSSTGVAWRVGAGETNGESVDPSVLDFQGSPMRDLEEDEILERLQTNQESFNSEDNSERSRVTDPVIRRLELWRDDLRRNPRTFPTLENGVLRRQQTDPSGGSLLRQIEEFLYQRRMELAERERTEQGRVRNSNNNDNNSENNDQRVQHRSPSPTTRQFHQVHAFFRQRLANGEGVRREGPPPVLDQDEYENWVNAFQPVRWDQDAAWNSRTSTQNDGSDPNSVLPSFDTNVRNESEERERDRHGYWEHIAFTPLFDTPRPGASSSTPYWSYNQELRTQPMPIYISNEARVGGRHQPNNNNEFIILGEPIEGLPLPLNLRGRRFNFFKSIDLNKEPVYDIYCGNQYLDADEDGESGTVPRDTDDFVRYVWPKVEPTSDGFHDPMWKGKGKEVFDEETVRPTPFSGGCGRLLCARGMKVEKSSCGIIAAPGHFKTTKKYYVSDAPPCASAAGLGHCETRRDGWKCKTETICCVSCGNEVGFRILQNCHICQASRETAAFFYFFPRSTSAIPRPLVDRPPSTPKAINEPHCSWATIPSVQDDFRDGLISDPMNWIGGPSGGEEWIKKATSPRSKNRSNAGELDDRGMSQRFGDSLNISPEDIAWFREAHELARLRRGHMDSASTSSRLVVPPQPLPQRSPPANPTPLDRVEMQRRVDLELPRRLFRSRAIRVPRIAPEEPIEQDNNSHLPSQTGQVTDWPERSTGPVDHDSIRDRAERVDDAVQGAMWYNEESARPPGAVRIWQEVDATGNAAHPSLPNVPNVMVVPEHPHDENDAADAPSQDRLVIRPMYEDLDGTDVFLGLGALGWGGTVQQIHPRSVDRLDR